MLVGTIGVSTEKLVEKGAELSDVIAQIKRQFAETERVINASVSYWNGKVADTIRQEYSTISAEVQEVLNKLEEYPKDLQTMAGVYDTHNAAVLQATEQLPGDVLL